MTNLFDTIDEATVAFEEALCDIPFLVPEEEQGLRAKVNSDGEVNIWYDSFATYASRIMLRNGDDARDLRNYLNLLLGDTE